jgi:aldehyde dehydrogenase (NAD+)
MPAYAGAMGAARTGKGQVNGTARGKGASGARAGKAGGRGQGRGDAAIMELAPAPESIKVAIAPRYGCFIDGAFVAPGDGETFATVNPANGQVLSQIQQAGAVEVDAAVGAARAALAEWQGLSGLERGKFLFRIARRVAERARELAILETMDTGKPIKESRDFDVPQVMQHFFYYAGWADKLGYVKGGAAGAKAEGVGVCGQIIPWNFPLLMAAWKIAPALAAGCTVVLKPAETTPLSALRLAEIMQEAGLPKGVVNIVTGDGRTGSLLVKHAGIDKIAFTGSTEVGKKIAAEVAGTGKKLTLELGGKGAVIVFDDAPLDQVVEGIVQGIFFNQGQVCCAGSRLLVQEGVAETLIAKLRRRLASIRIGDPLDKNTDLGAINNPQQLARIREYLADGVAAGAELVLPTGSAISDVKDVERAMAMPKGVNAKGLYCQPCLLTGVQPGHRVAREEIFGPVLAVMTFRTPEEAVSRANNSPYGLSAMIWTDKGSKALSVARKMEAGVVWINTANQLDPASPFGGYKESGFGREGGRQGLLAYLK